MTRLNFVVPGADFSSSPLGKYKPFLSPRDSLYAAWLLGTDYGGNPLNDVSLNGRNLTLTGGEVGAKSFQASPLAYAVAGFHTAAAASANNELTLWAVAKSSLAQSNTLIGDGASERGVSVTANTDSMAAIYSKDAAGSLYPTQIGAVNRVGFFTVTAGGAGYTKNFPVVTTGGGGSTQATGTAIVSGGAVVRIELNVVGRNFTSAPTVSLASGDGTGATATATLGVDPDRANRYEFAAGSFTLTTQTAYRRWGNRLSGQTELTTGKVMASLGAIAQNLHLGFGTATGGNSFLNSAPEIVAAGVHSRALTTSELDAQFLQVQRVLAANGLTL